jgi:predicted nucleic acid-binding protein
MPEAKPVIVDTNIVSSALLKRQTAFMDFLLAAPQKFYLCERCIVEIFNHKEKIVACSELSKAEIAKFYHLLLSKTALFKEELISIGNWRTAHELCKDIDEADTPFIALTLELDGLLWTGDKVLKEGLKQKGFDQFFILPNQVAPESNVAGK